jgi:hypothetical protein
MNEIQHLARPKDGPAPRWFHVAVAASMVISAVSALIATLHTGRTMTALVEQNAKLVKAGSTPMLEFTHGNLRDGKRGLSFTVSNAGSGMARVIWFELKLDGKPMQNMGAVAAALEPAFVLNAKTEAKLQLTTSSVAGRMLSPKADVDVFSWYRPDDSETALLKVWSGIDQARWKRIVVEACFCSVFQECWTSKLNGDVPVSNPDCVNEKRVSLQG